MDFPEGFQPGPCCGVLAVAVCAGVTFPEAWDKLAKLERAKRFRGGTYTGNRSRALRYFKVPFDERRLPYRQKTTVMKFAEWQTRPGVLYMLTTGRHVVTVQDGMVMDQRGKAHFSEHWARRQIVEHVVEIKPKRKKA